MRTSFQSLNLNHLLCEKYPQMDQKSFVQSVINSVDRKQADEFASFFTESGSFRLSNQPCVHGKEKVQEYVTAFFDMIASTSHTTVSVDLCGDKIYWQGIVTYVRKDENAFSVPFCNVLTMENNQMQEYLVYVDNSKLFVEWAA